MSRDGYQWADTVAARMLLSAIERAKEQRGLSVRQAAKLLGYKQAVVLSHMASGRAPIPIDRAEEIARVFEVSPSQFLSAVLEQRHPEVNWKLISDSALSSDENNLADELEIILDAPLSALNAEQRRILREVVAEPRPSRRWLSVHELSIVERQRKASSHDRNEAGVASEVDEILAMIEEKDREG